MTDSHSGNRAGVVSLREITGGNLREILALRVTREQEKVYSRSNAYSIAEGHYPPDDDPVWIRAVYAGEVPVGFLMTSEDPDRGEYYLWRLMIDAGHQGRGFGFRAVELLMERIEATPNAKALLTSHLEGDGDAGSFYRKLGFEYTGEVLGERDRMMRLRLPRG
jgi:diamine N-acetyltransferase